MISISLARRVLVASALSCATLTGACQSSDPLVVEGAPVVVMGQVTSLASAGGAALAEGGTRGGIEVTVEGSAATAFTDDEGRFRLEVETADDRIVIRFRRGALDVRIALDGVTPGALLRVEVSLSDDDGEVVRRRDDRDDEFEGLATLVSLEGEAPGRTLRVELVHDHGSVSVDIVEGSTHFETDGDVLSFNGLLEALGRTDRALKIEGDGEVRDDGTVLASSIKVETDEHGPDDDDDQSPTGHSEFEGRATLVSREGDAPARSLVVSLTRESHTAQVEISEQETAFDATGDVRTFAELLAALDRQDLVVRIEGEGERRDDDAIVATSIRVETDDDGNDDDRPGELEFKGLASLVGVTGEAPTRTAQVRVVSDKGIWLVELIEGETSFDPSGDFHSVGSVLSALVQPGLVMRLEGKGTAGAGGSIVAATARAEVD